MRHRTFDFRVSNKVVSWVLVAFWMAIIFGFSSQNGEQSGELSSKIVRFLVSIFGGANENLFPILGAGIRIFAHGTVFFVLAILVFNALSKAELSLKKLVGITFLVCSVYAITDEIHQIFVPGRAAQIQDFLVDSFGILLGIFLRVKMLISFGRV